jgi:membrane protease YdiL (CAAX protease family)
MILLALVVLLRILDIMVLSFAERWGEAFLHKALGFVLVLAYLWAAGQSIAAIGLHRRRMAGALWIGAAGTILLYVLAFGAQGVVSDMAGQKPALVVAAIDNKTGLARPGVRFALWLLLGNVVNALMEESFFRGLMLPLFRRRFSPGQANVLQAVIFGLWHVVWPIRHLIAGRIDGAAALSESVVIAIASTLSGLVWGTMYLKTDSLWTPWIAHMINNSTLNLLHIRTTGGLDADLGVLYPVMMAGFVALLPWTRLWAKRLRMPELAPWGTSGQAESEQ